MVLDCLGRVESVSGEGRFVVRSTSAPEINETVYDSKGRKMGTVKRIFGPVDGPFVTVAADDPTALADIVGEQVYHKGESRNAKGKRKH